MINQNNMSYRFTIEQQSTGCKDKQFIQLNGFPYKETSYDPDDKHKSMGDIFKDAMIPLSIKVGKDKYWSFDSAWGLFEFPNKKVTEIIREKFEKKYGKDNIIIENYISKNGQIDKSYLLVVRGTALVTIYLTILSASPISNEYVNVDDVYIGVNNDPNMKENIIMNYGNPEQYHLIPNALRDRIKELYENAYKSADENAYKSADLKGAELFMKLSDYKAKKFNDLMNNRLENLSIEDVAFFSDHFKSILKYTELDISITSSNKDGTTREHNISDIIKKIDSVKAEKEHEMVLKELGGA
tara:strand:+ start:166 stop:1062 length:897 start_codon:yes stop_codon:yes gene_type:complete